MKLAVTQVVLGIVIIIAALWVTGWMIYHDEGTFRNPVTGADGELSWVKMAPEHVNLYRIARYGSFALPVLGILLVISGTIQAVKRSAQRFPVILQITAGVLVAALAVFIPTWGFPTTYYSVDPGSGDQLLKMFSSSSREVIAAQYSAAALVLPGLAAVAVGIAQLVKLRKTTST
jgi:hypothetical protein